jgi:GT2 family glycosyltransferase
VPEPPRLIAVVLNWNGGDDTPRALRSLAGIETICVDNGSTDGSDAEVERLFPGVELIRTGANLGFAGGSNVGIRRALERGAGWVLLLNNDAVAGEGIAAALERAATARPDAGLLACKIYVAGDPSPSRPSNKLSQGGEGETLQYAGASFNALLGYSGRVDGFGARDDGRFDALRDVGRADGAAMAVSRAAVERVGLLDESLFAYVEDVDWSLRIRAAGFAVVFVPEARVWHAGSASTGGAASTANLYYTTRNTLAVVERHRPLPPGLRAARRGVVVATHLLRAGRRRAGLAAVLEGWRDFRRGALGMRPRDRAPRSPR